MIERVSGALEAGRCKTSGESVKCPHCNEEIDMGQMGPGQEPRTAEDIRSDQSRAKLDDANASTRPTEVTVAELRKLRLI